MITYFVVIAIVLFFSYMAQGNYRASLAEGGEAGIQKNRDIKIFLSVVIATLTITAGCRYFVGTDYGNYKTMYEADYSKRTFLDLLNFDEPIFPIIGKISYLLFDGYFPMFFVASIITVGLYLHSTYKETTDFIFVTLLYIFAGIWDGGFNGIRQYIAITIVFMGRRFIAERRFWKFLLVCGLAFLAHKSAVFFVLIYFVYSEEFNTVRLLIVTLITIAVSRSYETLFDIVGWIKEEEYVINGYSAKHVHILRVLAGCAPAVLAIYYGFAKKLKKEQVFYAYMLIANAATWIATSDSAYLARLALYTGAFVPLGLSSILESAEKRHRNAMKIVVVILFAIFWFYEVIVSPDLRDFEWVFSYL